MIYYHVTDDGLVEKILREGLIGNPAVYLATSRLDALAIRACQERLKQRNGPVQVFMVNYSGKVYVDHHVRKTPFGFVAFLTFASILPQDLKLCY